VQVYFGLVEAGVFGRFEMIHVEPAPGGIVLAIAQARSNKYYQYGTSQAFHSLFSFNNSINNHSFRLNNSNLCHLFANKKIIND
jgi:hypothetical protein